MALVLSDITPTPHHRPAGGFTLLESEEVRVHGRTKPFM